MNRGCSVAVFSIRLWVDFGITAQRDCGSGAWRRRHIYSISSWGSSNVFGISMYEESVLIPGGLGAVVDGRSGLDVFPSAWWGGGGGGWNGKDGGFVIVAAFRRLFSYSAINSSALPNPSLSSGQLAARRHRCVEITLWPSCLIFLYIFQLHYPIFDVLLHSVYHVLEPIVFAKLSSMGRLLVQCGEGRVFERETYEEMIFDISKSRDGN